MQMQYLGSWFSGGLGSSRLMVGLDELGGFFQHKLLYNPTSTTVKMDFPQLQVSRKSLWLDLLSNMTQCRSKRAASKAEKGGRHNNSPQRRDESIPASSMTAESSAHLAEVRGCILQCWGQVTSHTHHSFILQKQQHSAPYCSVTKQSMVYLTSAASRLRFQDLQLPLCFVVPASSLKPSLQLRNQLPKRVPRLFPELLQTELFKQAQVIARCQWHSP